MTGLPRHLVEKYAELRKNLVPAGLDEIPQFIYLPKLGISITHPGVLLCNWRAGMKIPYVEEWDMREKGGMGERDSGGGECQNVCLLWIFFHQAVDRHRFRMRWFAPHRKAGRQR